MPDYCVLFDIGANFMYESFRRAGSFTWITETIRLWIIIASFLDQLSAINYKLEFIARRGNNRRFSTTFLENLQQVFQISYKDSFRSPLTVNKARHIWGHFFLPLWTIHNSSLPNYIACGSFFLSMVAKIRTNKIIPHNGGGMEACQKREISVLL